MVPKNAEAGDARGMCLYAQMLENGLGVKKKTRSSRGNGTAGPRRQDTPHDYFRLDLQSAGGPNGKAFSRTLRKMWVRFAKTGKPFPSARTFYLTARKSCGRRTIWKKRK